MEKQDQRRGKKDEKRPNRADSQLPLSSECPAEQRGRHHPNYVVTGETRHKIYFRRCVKSPTGNQLADGIEEDSKRWQGAQFLSLMNPS